MTATGITSAPWPVTTAVACLPVTVLGMGAALAHLLHQADPEAQPAPAKRSTPTQRPAMPPTTTSSGEGDEAKEHPNAPQSCLVRSTHPL